MILSVLIYGITFLWSTILFIAFQKLYFKHSLLAIIILVMSVIPPICLFAFRDYSIGWDTKRYIPVYQYIKTIPLELYLEKQKVDINCRFELGYYLLNRISYFIFDSYHTVMFFSVIIMLVFAYWVFIVYRQNHYTYVSVFIFYLTVYTQGMDVVRFSIGSSICMVAFLALINKKIISYIFLIILASCFQKIFIVFLVYVLFINLKNAKLNLMRDLIFYIGIFTCPFLISISLRIMSKIPSFSYYFEYYKINYTAWGIGFLKDIIPVIPITYLYYKKLRHNYQNRILFNISLTTIPLCYIAYFVTSAVRMKRISYLAWLFLVPTILENIDDPKNRNCILIYYLFVFLSFYFCEFVVLKSGGQYPYLFM